MRAAVDVQDVTSDRRGVGQVHDRIRDVLDRRRPTHRRQALHHVLRSLPVKRRVDDAGRDGVHADAVFAYSIARCWVIVSRPPLVIIGTAAVTPRIGLRARAAVIVTMLPPVVCANICLMESWVTYRKPSTFVETSDLKSSAV